MDQPGSDRTLEQFAFIFLVALGVDYNVFLLARIREERDRDPDTEGRRPSPRSSGPAASSPAPGSCSRPPSAC